MKRKFKDEDKVGFFGRIKKKISDWFYDLSVRGAEFRKKHSSPKKNITVKNRKLKRRLFYIAIVTIPMLHWLIFYVGVNINSVLLAFKEWKINPATNKLELTWAGFKNFKEFFFTLSQSGNDFGSMMLNSLFYYAIGLLTGTTLALLFSYYIYKKYFFSEFFRVVLFLPAMISSVVTVLMYKYMIDHGVTEIAEMFGKQIIPPMGNQEYQKLCVVLFSLIMGFGANILMYSSAMSRIPLSVVEYAAIDGVGALREFVSITLPLIYGTLSTFLITGITSIFTNQQELYTLYGTEAKPHIATMGYYMFKITYNSPSETDYPEAAALGLLFTAVAIPLTFFMRWVLGKLDPDVQY